MTKVAALLPFRFSLPVTVPAAFGISPDETDARRLWRLYATVRTRTVSSTMWMKVQDDTGSSRERPRSPFPEVQQRDQADLLLPLPAEVRTRGF